MNELWRRIAFYLDRERLSRELDEELEMHRQMASPESFGNATRWRENSREVWISAWVEGLLQDVRFGARQLARNPNVALTIIVSLALGLGATTAMFSLTNALLFKALPVEDPERLVVVVHGADGDRGPSMSYPSFAKLRKQGETVADLFAYAGWRTQFRSGAMERKIHLGVVSGNFYSALQVRAQAGRLLEPSNDQRGSSFDNAVVLSDRLWRGSFHADREVIGKKVFLDGVPFIVAGVTPENFFGVDPGTYPDATITLAATEIFDPHSPLLDCRQCNTVEVMGRLRPEVSTAQAESALQLEWRGICRESDTKDLSPLFRKSSAADRLFLDPGGNGPDSYLRSTFVKPLYLLFGMSALILLAACSNVANLLLARALARRRELAVRLSIGASRPRVVRQSLTESTMLAVLGLVGGAVVYEGCIRGLLQFLQDGSVDVFLDTRPDTRMIFFTLALTAVTTLLFGLVPAVRASRAPLRGVLSENAQNASGNSKLGRGILAMQIGISFTLLIGAILLARSLYELRNFDAGFRRDHLLVASPDVGKAIPSASGQLLFARRLVSRLETLRAVRSVSASTLVPGGGASWAASYIADGFESGDKENALCYLNFVSPHFFATMGTPLLLGRDFGPADERSGAPLTAIVSESFARHFWGNENAIGKRIHETDKVARITVIGVARDARHRSFRQPAPRTVYLPFPPPASEGLMWGFHIELWTQTNPESLIAAVRKAFREENSQVPVELHTFNTLIDRRLLYERLLTAIAICFGVLGTLMSGIGVYGVAAYSASRRTLEVGIRVALGATKPQIVGLFVSEQLLIAFTGLTVGVVGALTLTRFLQTWLFGVSRADVRSFTAGVFILAGVSAIATFIPAARALRIEPWRALRSE
jgi:predicted permease